LNIDMKKVNDVEISTIMDGREFSLNPVDFSIPDGSMHIAGTSHQAVIMPMKP